MAHMLEIIGGEASFAYDASKNQHPWHALGVKVDGLGTIEQMLVAARANYEVRTAPVVMVTDSGMTVIPDRFATFRPHPLAGMPVLDKDGNPELDTDGRTPKTYPVEQFLGFVSDEYKVNGHDSILQIAYGIVEAAEGAALVDTAGVLEDGKRFFSYVKFPEPILIDPNGIADKIEYGLGVHARHDGKGSTQYFGSKIRSVCSNTVEAGENAAEAVYALPHSVDPSNQVEIVGQARIVLGLANQWAADIVRTSERLLAVPMTDGLFHKVVDTIWPKPTDLSDRQEKLRASFQHTMSMLWEAPTNSGGFGKNGYTVVQTIGEYLDHYRRAGKGGQESRARASLGIDHGVSNTQQFKRLATDVVLDMARPMATV